MEAMKTKQGSLLHSPFPAHSSFVRVSRDPGMPVWLY